MHVLLIEDHPEIAEVVVIRLENDGMTVVVAANAADAAERVYLDEFNILIVDVMLPEGNDAGFELVARLRQDGVTTPVLFLSARADIDSKVQGLDYGDDYLPKPFDLRELSARVRSVARRVNGQASNVLALPRNLTLDLSAQRIVREGKPVHVTPKEYALLERFALHPGRLYSRDELLNLNWPDDRDPDPKLIDVYISNLRRKLGDGVLETVRGVGDRLNML